LAAKRRSIPGLFSGFEQKYYNAGLYFVNFSQSAEVRDKINVWVEDKTHDKIQDLIKPPIPLPETSLILCNAIYFKGNWLSQFDKKIRRMMISTYAKIRPFGFL